MKREQVENIIEEYSIFIDGMGKLIIPEENFNALIDALSEEPTIDDVFQEEEECEHPRSERDYIGMGLLRCRKCGVEFS